MEASNSYRDQVQLLVRILPHIAKEECFALKGGTALNLFIRDLPRLSVDVDLTYTPIEERKTSLATIKRRLENIIYSIKGGIPGIQLTQSSENRIIARQNDTQVKIEFSPVLRGCVYPPEVRTITDKAEEEFGYVEINVMSFNDLYAGKICAALDRQHPRDLFDIKLLLENEGISRELFQTFLVYLISHNRPIVELLAPRLSDIRDIFENEFATMTQDEISVEDLESTRASLISVVQSSLSDEDKDFLISFKNRTPEWTLLGLENVSDLPAVKWKLANLNKMDDNAHAKALDKLRDALSSW